MHEIGDFSVGVAVHPECHPASTDRTADRQRQAEKLAIADFGLSQFFFDADVWFEFLGDLDALGVTTPVIPGIMPVTNVKSVKRMSEMAGAAFPAALEQRLRAVEDDDDAMRAVGDGGRDRAVPRPHGRRRALVPLLHAQPFERDPRDLRQSRFGTRLTAGAAEHRTVNRGEPRRHLAGTDRRALLDEARGGTLREAARIVPDTVRLVRRLAADKTLRRGVRVRLWLLLAYLASPIDLVPDFIPVIGFADDAIVTSLVLRSVIKHAGRKRSSKLWPGTSDGLATLVRICRLSPERGSSPPHGQARRRLVRTGYASKASRSVGTSIGIVVLAVAALAARSVALAGFGLDSLIEIGASTVVIWELSGTGRGSPGPGDGAHRHGVSVPGGVPRHREHVRAGHRASRRSTHRSASRGRRRPRW